MVSNNATAAVWIFDYWSKVIAPNAAVFAAVAACVVSAVQMRIAKKTLKFNLYEKRLAIFKSSRRMLSSCETYMDRTDLDSDGKSREQIVNFIRETAEHRFLFKKDMVAYIDGIRILAIDLRTKMKQKEKARESKDLVSFNKLQGEDEILVEKLLKYDSGLDDRFAKYLDFTKD